MAQVVEHLPSKCKDLSSNAISPTIPLPNKEEERKTKPDLVVHACNPSTQEVQAGILRVHGQPGL
jgi:hypothetical protein